MQFLSAKDKNPIYGNMTYYGIIKEIRELDYYTFTIPVFKCDWVENKNEISVDKLGFTLFNLNKLGHDDNPFILASQAN